MADVFSNSDVKTLLQGKKILFIGDSNVRCVYKDLLCMATRNKLIRACCFSKNLRTSFSDDQLLMSEGDKGSWSYIEHRIFEHGFRIELLYMSRLNMSIIDQYIERINVGRNAVPDLVYFSSCWPQENEEENFVRSLAIIMTSLKLTMPKGSKIIFGTAFPMCTDSFGDPLLEEIIFLRTSPKRQEKINTIMTDLGNNLGFHSLDPCFYFQMSIFRGASQSSKCERTALRFLTNLFLTKCVYTSHDEGLVGIIENCYPHNKYILVWKIDGLYQEAILLFCNSFAEIWNEPLPGRVDKGVLRQAQLSSLACIREYKSLEKRPMPVSNSSYEFEDSVLKNTKIALKMIKKLLKEKTEKELFPLCQEENSDNDKLYDLSISEWKAKKTNDAGELNHNSVESGPVEKFSSIDHLVIAEECRKLFTLAQEARNLKRKSSDKINFGNTKKKKSLSISPIESVECTASIKKKSVLKTKKASVKLLKPQFVEENQKDSVNDSVSVAVTPTLVNLALAKSNVNPQLTVKSKTEISSEKIPLSNENQIKQKKKRKNSRRTRLLQAQNPNLVPPIEKNNSVISISSDEEDKNKKTRSKPLEEFFQENCVIQKIKMIKAPFKNQKDPPKGNENQTLKGSVPNNVINSNNLQNRDVKLNSGSNENQRTMSSVDPVVLNKMSLERVSNFLSALHMKLKRTVPVQKEREPIEIKSSGKSRTATDISFNTSYWFSRSGGNFPDEINRERYRYHPQGKFNRNFNTGANQMRDHPRCSQRRYSRFSPMRTSEVRKYSFERCGYFRSDCDLEQSRRNNSSSAYVPSYLAK